MRVIGVDPGTLKLGWGVIEEVGTRRHHLGHGTLVLTGETLADRLVGIEEGLVAVLAEHRPEAAAVESLFFAKNAQSAAKLGHARGVVLLLLRRAGLEVGEYAPAQIKKAIVGRGRADKRQMAHVVMSVLGLREPPQSDAADALAVALAHVGHMRLAAAMAKCK
ncbi:MAG: crossover junction endodeoxyribonuclease RuvC [Deltaproteobacteria bacterium]|nr:crossover junction endodeoxyribonuclease RuvC [Deltaproteobacteria bacterium]